MKHVSNNRRIRDGILAVILIAGVYAVLYILGIGCPIRFLTGISCAGCGMERAWIALLHGNISEAFYYHPLFFMPVIWVFLLINRKKLSQKSFNVVLFISVALFLIVYFYRMFFGNGEVVRFEPKESIIYRLIKRFIRLEDINVL